MIYSMINNDIKTSLDVNEYLKVINSIVLLSIKYFYYTRLSICKLLIVLEKYFSLFYFLFKKTT